MIRYNTIKYDTILYYSILYSTALCCVDISKCDTFVSSIQIMLIQPYAKHIIFIFTSYSYLDKKNSMLLFLTNIMQSNDSDIRVNGVLAVSRAFGDTRFKNTNSWRDSHTGESKGPVIAVPDIYSEVCTPLTEFCIIATDGLWDVMSPQLAVNFVRTKMSMKCDLQKCVKELVLDALKNGGSVDNVTVVLLSFHMPVGEI